MSETIRLQSPEGALNAVFSTRGAELLSLTDERGCEYIFRDPSVWGFSAPVLFPICGGLDNDTYTFEGKTYTLPKHGFCRTREFVLETFTDNSAVFLTTDSEDTRGAYPFSFEFRIIYTLVGRSLNVTYQVKNKTGGVMPFSVGAHEAYACPGGIEGYDLVFDEKETLDTMLVKGNLMDTKSEQVLTDSDTLPLKYDYFSVDALVFTRFRSHGVVLAERNGSRRVRLDYPGFTNLLVWTMPNVKAPYVCLEPWCGYPDTVESDGNILHKKDIIILSENEEKAITHTITIL